ncbi:MAG: TlpA family protein disulfide reductase [Fimbriimonadaceae bacterium]|nr:TlpA family protein disulfide reductase [Fimbriimonadaceae bacterium]
MTTLLAVSILAASGFDLTFVPKGMTAKMGGYSPVRAEMTVEAAGVKTKPAGLTAAQFGTMTFGNAKFAFALDEPEGGQARLFLDSNGNGDLTDDPAATWESRKQGDFTMWSGSGVVTLNGKEATVNAYRFDKNDPQRAALKNTLLYYGDFGYEGTGTIGGQTYKIAFVGGLSANARVWVDRNGNGKNDGRSESVSGPFNFGGTTYEFKVVGQSLEAVVSEKSVDEIPLPPDLSVGKPAPSFNATDLDGEKLAFPGAYKGKVVMLDFWATWCGPCIAELPNVVKAYEKYHDRGFDILGISFDQPNKAEDVAKFLKEHKMPWRQVYEGKFWSTTIGMQYGVEAIPFVLLVDGSTGNILATVRDLRGANLDKTLEQVFSSRAK